jgi:RHS repeat-associated protein
VTYDNNGNILSDGFHTYTWDADGKLATLDGNAETYDALGRRVEQLKSSDYTEIVYGPAGNKLALMSGQTVTKVFAPLPGGAAAVYTSGGLSYYRHPDWLGSSRLASTPTAPTSVYYDGAYAPFGEPFAGTGTADHNFTGQNQDMAPDLYDFLAREQHPTQGRWVSPDPAGINAVDPTNPQSWNRYAYALNNPLALIDPLGLEYWWAGNCLYFDQYAYVDGQFDSVDTYFIGCYNRGTGQFQPGGGGGSGGASSAKTFASSAKTFTNPCPPVPDQPHVANLDQNVAEARSNSPLTYIVPLGTAVTLNWFYNQVRNRGPWDYKQVTTLNDYGTRDPSPYQDFGNFNYGATGTAAGFPQQLLLRAAGGAQIAAGTSQLDWGTPTSATGPYGDDPRDQAMIMLGGIYVQNSCHQ